MKKNLVKKKKMPKKKPWKEEYVEKEAILQCWKEQRRESSNICEITCPEIVTSGIFVKPVIFLTVNPRGLLPLRELHSTDETTVWKDPGGSWACLPPVYKYNHPATVCDTCGLRPKEHTKKRGALGNIKKTKITRRAGTWVEEVYEKDPKGRIQNERSPVKC